MNGRGGGRDRFRKDFSWRSDEKSSSHGRSNAPPPSRHLWVGNLSHHMSESILSEQFLRFGEIESIAFLPGRSYAFVNFRKEEDALIAVRGLQGYFVAGLPLKIEFAKADKSLASAHDEEYLKRKDGRGSAERETSFLQRDSRGRPTSLEPSDNSKVGDKNAEPSEVLWIGFPASLNVDEMVLRMAFSPFGEIEKVTAFPGRSYAFVQFRNVMASSRAKEALQGKLFNNPRVNICFARKESGPEHGRHSMNDHFSPHLNSSGHSGHSPLDYRQDRYFGNLVGEPRFRSPHFISDLESIDSGVTGFRNSFVRPGGNGDFEPLRLHGGSQFGFSENLYKRHRSSPARERNSHPNDFPPEGPPYEDRSDLPADDFPFNEAKKMKTSSFSSNKELIQYPFTGSAQEKQFTGFSRPFMDFPEQETYDKSFGSGPFSYNRDGDRQSNMSQHGERDDHWKAPNERFEAGSGSLPINPVQRQVFTPEPQQSPKSPKSEVWKWEGTIAKGGTPVCRARCFPVGKVMDFKLPEFLDCTARTGLEMLAKHFYQAASSWVVFFVPESDADIAFYNEFLHYLGEKQRAAVAKLGEKTTLFLVPPSDFSEKVLKVPGKMSISGVILRFQHSNSDFGSPHHPLEAMDSKLPSFQSDPSYAQPTSTDFIPSTQGQSQSYINSASEPFPPFTPLPIPRTPGQNDHAFPGNIPGSTSSASFSGSSHLTGRTSESLNDNRYSLPPPPPPPLPPLPPQPRNSTFSSNWSPHQAWNSNPGTGSLPPQVSNTAAGNFLPQLAQETSSSQYTPGVLDLPASGPGNFTQQETRPAVSSTLSVPSLQPEQLAQLASLLGKRQQSLQENRNQPSLMSQSVEQTFGSSQKSMSNQSSSSNPSTSQFSQPHHQMPQTSSAPPPPQAPPRNPTELLARALERQGNSQLQNTGGQEESDTDPQKRLQATLQLAATLLQQIQQQSKGGDQR